MISAVIVKQMGISPNAIKILNSWGAQSIDIRWECPGSGVYRKYVWYRNSGTGSISNIKFAAQGCNPSGQIGSIRDFAFAFNSRGILGFCIAELESATGVIYISGCERF